MKQYVCSICGYVYDEAVSGPWEALPADWKCPICKAGKEAFRVREEAPQPQAQLEKPHVEMELFPMEMSIICSNLARGCEKQYLFPQMEAFQKLADFFRSQVTPPAQASREDLLKLVEQDLEGMQVMRFLGRNMAYFLKCIEAGRKAGVPLPREEGRIATNFIR